MEPKEKWSEEFDKRFPEFVGVGAQFPIFSETPNRDHIKQFISETLSSYKTSLKEEIKRMKDTTGIEYADHPMDDESFAAKLRAIVRNKALSETIEVIK